MLMGDIAWWVEGPRRRVRCRRRPAARSTTLGWPDEAKEPSVRTLRVRDVMKTRVVAVTPSTPFREVAELMVRHGIGAVPVIDDAGELVGLISEADLLTKEAYGGRRRSFLGALPGLGRQESYGMLRSRGRVAREIMSAPVETAIADDALRLVARRMVETRHARR
jgi:CBS domain-containing protein